MNDFETDLNTNIDKVYEVINNLYIDDDYTIVQQDVLNNVSDVRGRDVIFSSFSGMDFNELENFNFYHTFLKFEISLISNIDTTQTINKRKYAMVQLDRIRREIMSALDNGEFANVTDVKYGNVDEQPLYTKGTEDYYGVAYSTTVLLDYNYQI